MAQKNQGPVLVAGLETAFVSGRAGVQAQPIGKGACVAIVIQNRLSNIDDTGNNVVIMVGYGAGQLYQMLPGQESPIIYCSDLEDIYVRVQSGTTECDFAVFVYRLAAG